MTMSPEVERLVDAKIKKPPSLSKQIVEIDWCIYFWAHMHQWSVNLGQMTSEQAQKKLEPLKAVRSTLENLARRAKP